MTIHSFIAGTPLHVMISLSLIEQLGIAKTAHLKIVDHFLDAKGLFERINNHSWELADISYSFFSSKRKAYLSCIKDNTTNIYLDSDVGFQTSLDMIWMKSLKRNLKISIFEDGMGSYRTDLYSGIKKRMFNSIGIATFLGGSPITNSMFVYEKDRYKTIFPKVSASVVEIQEPLFATIKRLSDSLFYFFKYEIRPTPLSETCIVYLSSWNVDMNFMEKLRTMGGDVFVKLHPHIRQFPQPSDINFLQGSVPAEIILSDMISKYRHITVYHHFSSVEQYIKDDKVRFVQI